MKSNNFFSMFVAVILGLGVAGFVYFLQNKSQSGEGANFEVTKVLVAKLRLRPGDTAGINKFRWVEFPTDSVHKDFYTFGNEEDIKKVKGSVVRYEILEGEPLKKTDLVNVDKKSVLSAFISPNMKAVSVPLKKVANANVHITPGDFIDIILPKRSGKKQSVDTVLSGIKVIAVDGKFFKQEGVAPVIAKNITLEVDAVQAEALALSISHGRIVISQHSALTPISNAGGIKKIKQPKKIIVQRGSFG